MKNKLIITFLILIPLIIFTIFCYNPKTIETSSTPISNHTLIIDAGHGKPDSGATSSFKSKTEEELNLIICQKLQKYLETSGCNVILTRSDNSSIYSCTEDSSISEKKKSDMNNRVLISNYPDAEAFLSIHMNKLPDSKYYRLSNIL